VRRAAQLVLLLPAALAVVLLGGCGGGGGGGSDDPASVAPADAPVYIQATLQPTGALKSNTEAAISTITAETDPGKAIVDLIDKQAKSDGSDITYANDIKPWLGERAGLFVDGFDNGKAAVILQVSNEDAAKAFEDKSVKINNGGGVKDASYNGVDYKLESDGDASGFVDGFLVSGDEGAFKEAVDASKGDSLADSSSFKDTINRAPGDSLANLYVDLGTFYKDVQASSDAQGQAFYNSFLASKLNGGPALASLIPSAEKIEIDTSTSGSGSGSSASSAAGLISSFPAGAFAAFAAPGVGTFLKDGIDQIDSNGFPPSVPPGVLKARLAQAGVDLDAIAGSIADAGAFVSGDAVQNARAALVLTADDPASAKQAVSSFESLISRAGQPGYSPLGAGNGFQLRVPALGPQPLVVESGGDRIVIAYGAKAAAEALGGGQTLGGTLLYKSAVDGLGSDVDLSAYVDVQHLIGLALAAGGGSHPQLSAAKPYLDHLTYLAFGSAHSGGNATGKAVLGLTK
jgi:hypothetical protein